MRQPWAAGRLPALAIIAALLATASPAAAAAPTVRVSGNRLVDGAGRTLQLRGVNRAGFEFVCRDPAYGPARVNGVSLGPLDAGSIAAMRRWGVNAVRIPLNEHCWLGVNPVTRTATRVTPVARVQAAAAGRRERTRYRAVVRQYVSRLHAAGLVVILDLHRSAPGTTIANNTWRLPNADHSVTFWRSVARTFRNDRSMLFDLFNEPLNVSWSCLRNGCTLPNACANCPTARRPRGSYRAVGMQTLVNAVRSTGARQPLMVPGLQYSHDLSRWLAHRPADPRRQIVASFHNYTRNNHAFCSPGCWEAVIAPIAAAHPVVTGEFGQFDCGREWVDRYMAFADRHNISYLAWAWVPPDPRYDKTCGDGEPQLITDYAGTPSDQTGVAIRDHYRARAGR